MLEPVVASLALVAVSEMGDKTQLLAFALATRFRNPWVVIGGILFATVVNHGLAAGVGVAVAGLLTPGVLAWVLTVSFFVFGAWMLVPDHDDDREKTPRFGPFLTTAVLFFLAEMGDKTQCATVALGARYHSVLWVTMGTTLGMLLADGLAVFLGDRLAAKVQGRWMRLAAAALFFVFGIISLTAALLK